MCVGTAVQQTDSDASSHQYHKCKTQPHAFHIQYVDHNSSRCSRQLHQCSSQVTRTSSGRIRTRIIYVELPLFPDFWLFSSVADYITAHVGLLKQVCYRCSCSLPTTSINSWWCKQSSPVRSPPVKCRLIS